MQLLIMLLLLSVFAVCLFLGLTWPIRIVGYSTLILKSWTSISLARSYRKLDMVQPQAWVAIPILLFVLILRLYRLPASTNLELSLAVICMNLIFLLASVIMCWPAGQSVQRIPPISKKIRNKRHKLDQQNNQG